MGSCTFSAFTYGAVTHVQMFVRVNDSPFISEIGVPAKGLF